MHFPKDPSLHDPGVEINSTTVPPASQQAEAFVSISVEFRLGDLVTEQSHPVTRELSQTAKKSIPDALGLLFKVDADVVSTYRKWIKTEAPARIAATVRDALLSGGKLFFTGCGATGRLSILLESIWREFWSRGNDLTPVPSPTRRGETSPSQRGTVQEERWSLYLPGLREKGETSPEHPAPNGGPIDPRTPGSLVKSVMAGGDFALIKSVEGFEDFAQFGAKQIEDAGVSKGDVVFAITEGGETSFVIGTAWKGLEKGAKVYFVYNNPDDVLRKSVTRSRKVLDEPRIEKINLTTGPMAVMGSTRMQATTVQLCAMLTILEMATRDLLGRESASVPQEFLAALEEVHSTLSSVPIREQLAKLVELEEAVYRSGKKSTYFADRLGIDVLTDTTERSPTFCIPAFRKWDDLEASESWTYMILPYSESELAWENLLKRPPCGLAWTEEEIQALVGPERAARQADVMRLPSIHRGQIGTEEILRFRIGLNGLASRPIEPEDAAVSVISEQEIDALTSSDGFYRTQLEKASTVGASSALVFLGCPEELKKVKSFLESWDARLPAVLLPIPKNNLLLGGIDRIAVKMLLNALSTCTMVRLGRVIGNCMIAVVPSNLKLIDRSIRYIQTLTGLSYKDACLALFESIEYVRPRMQAGREYPPTVALSVIRARHGCSFEEAESLMRGEISC